MKRINPATWTLVAVATLFLVGILFVITNNRADAVSGNAVESVGIERTDEGCTPTDAWTETVTVVDVPAHTTVEFDHWQRYSWTGGPHTADAPPPFPSEHWQANTASDPHGVGEPGPYFRSHGNSGNGDWFYLEMTMVTIEHPAETHEETIEHPAVECPTDPPTDPPTTDTPTTEPPVTEPPVVETPEPEIGTGITVERHDDAPLPETGA